MDSFEPSDAYYEEDLLKVGDFISSWDGLLDENLGSILKNVLPDLEEFGNSSSQMEQGYLQGKPFSTEADLEATHVALESTERIWNEWDPLQLADKFYKVIDRAWFEAVAPWKFCLMIYQERDPKIRSIVETEMNRKDMNIVVCTNSLSHQGVETCLEDEILFPKEQYVLAYCLMDRIWRCRGGESPLLFRFFREAINVGYILSRRALETIICLFYHHLSIANRHLLKDFEPNNWVYYLKSIYGDVIPEQVFDWEGLRTINNVYSSIQLIYCIVDWMENFRFDTHVEEPIQSKLVLVVTELLLCFVLQPWSVLQVSHSINEGGENDAYMEEEVVQLVSRVSAALNDYRTVALIRVCGRRHSSIWKSLTSWIQTFGDLKSYKLSVLIDGFILSWIDKNQLDSERQMDAESFLKQFYDSRKLGALITTKIYQFWMGPYDESPPSPPPLEQLGKALEELAKAASSQRENVASSQHYYQLFKQQCYMMKECLRHWLTCPNLTCKSIQERWGDESAIASRTSFLLYKFSNLPLDEYMSMVVAFALTQLVVMYSAWNIYSSYQSGSGARIVWFRELLEKWIRSHALSSSRSFVSMVLWMLYFSFHARLVSGSVSTYFRIVRGISFIRTFAVLESHIAYSLCWIIMDELDKAVEEEEETLHFFSDKWPIGGKWGE